MRTNPVYKYFRIHTKHFVYCNTRVAVPVSRVLAFLGLLTLMSLSKGIHALELENSPGNWQQQEFLPANKAFPFSIQQRGSQWQITWDISDGYYLYEQSIAIIDADSKKKLGLPEFKQKPHVVYDPNFDKDMAIFKGRLQTTFSFEQSLPNSAALRFQGCAEAGLCYPMQTQPLFQEQSEKEQIDTTSLAGAQNTENLYNSFTAKFTKQGIDDLLADASLLKISIIFLLLGIGLCLTPCVLPMMPIISSLVLGRKDLNPLQAFSISSVYVLAMSATYTLVGVMAASLGASANIQIWMQEPWVLSLFAAAFVVLALSMFGVYELQLPQAFSQKVNELSQKQKGGSLLSAVILGVLSAILVSPCISAPLAGALVFISSTGDLWIGGSALFALGLGMGLPLIALCTFGNSFLPKSGNWLYYSKRFFGLLLIAVAIWMLSRFMNAQVILVLWGALFILASFSFGSWSRADPLLRVIRIILLLWGIMSILGAALGNTNPLQPLENLGQSRQDQSTHQLQFTTIESIPELERALAKHKNSGKILLLDFYADWCSSCKEIEHAVFENPQFETFLSDLHLYRADLSDNSAENFELLETLNLFGPPAILFYDDQSRELSSLRIQGAISPKNFQQIVNQIQNRYSR